MINRREFIKTMSLFSGVLLAPVHRLGKWLGLQPLLVDETLEVGELFAGFLLLPEGVEVPEFVQDVKHGMPNMCGIGREDDGSLLQAVYTTLNDAADLAMISKLPIYTLDEAKLPDGLVPAGASLITHRKGYLYSGGVSYEAYDEKTSVWYTAVSVEAVADFPRPLPLWYDVPVEGESPKIVFTKVDFVPGGAGLMISTPFGFTLHSSGSVLNNPQPETPWNINIGQVPPYISGQNCYGGTHVHLNAKAFTGVVLTRNSNLNCGSGVSAGGTTIYTWTY